MELTIPIGTGMDVTYNKQSFVNIPCNATEYVAILFQRIIYGKTKFQAYKMLYFNTKRILTNIHSLTVYRICMRCFRNCFIHAG